MTTPTEKSLGQIAYDKYKFQSNAYQKQTGIGIPLTIDFEKLDKESQDCWDGIAQAVAKDAVKRDPVKKQMADAMKTCLTVHPSRALGDDVDGGAKSFQKFSIKSVKDALQAYNQEQEQG